MKKMIGYALVAAYVLTVVLSAWAVEYIGPVSVGFGLVAPAGIWFVGIGFTLRDFVQRTFGKKMALACIGVGVVLSILVNPTLAYAAAAAFLVSETVDLLVYTALRARLIVAVVLSNLVSAFLDSLIFLSLAFGSTEFLLGQFVGKTWMTVAAVIAIALYRAVMRKREQA